LWFTYEAISILENIGVALCVMDEFEMLGEKEI
jgi:hypothetical protein